MSVETLVDYLRAAAADRGPARSLHEPQPFVTLSRQAGVPGEALGAAIAARLSRVEGREWRVLDRELCERVAADRHLAVALESLEREAYRGSVEESISRLVSDQSPQAAITRATFRVVRAAAVAGRVVIVGRAGNLVTRDLPLGVHLRAVLARPQRVVSLERRLEITRREADKECGRLDVSRARLIKDCFGRDIDDPLLYDAVLNVAGLPAEIVAEVVAQLVLARCRVVQRA